LNRNPNISLSSVDFFRESVFILKSHQIKWIPVFSGTNGAGQWWVKFGDIEFYPD
jgi:hypothetical protein